MSFDSNIYFISEDKGKISYSLTNNYLTIGNNGADVFNITLEENVGIGVTDPTVKLEINSTDAVLLPKGTTAERPTGVSGYMRFNTTTNQFEGYSNSNWGSLGGVIDTDQDTYILAESSAGADNDELSFFTTEVERMRIDSSGNILLNNILPYNEVDNGTILLSAPQSTNYGLRFRNSGTPAGKAYSVFSHYTTDHWFLSNNDGSFSIKYDNTDTEYPSIDDATEFLTIDTSGLVSLGVATTPQHSLEVKDTLFIQAASDITQSMVNTDDKGLYLYYLTVGGLSDIGTIKSYSSSGLESFQIQANPVYINSGTGFTTTNGIMFQDGMIAIDTTSPTEKLHIVNGNIYISTSDYGILFGSNKNFSIKHTGTGFSFNLADTSIHYIKNVSGQVGVGTNSFPSSEMMRIYAPYTSYYSRITFTNTITEGSNDGSYIGLSNTGSDLSIFNQESANLILGTNNIERMRITSSGNVGIGTSGPEFLLHTYTSGTGFTQLFWGQNPSTTENSKTALLFGQSNTTGNRGQLVFNYVSSNSDLNYVSLGFHSAGDLFNVLKSGNVGIGTTAPLTTLDVRGTFLTNTGTTGTLHNYLGGSASIALALTNYTNSLTGDSFRYSANSTSSQIGFRISATEQLYITNTGVGIGTTTPDTDLHIVKSNASIKLQNTNTSAGRTSRTRYYNNAGTLLSEMGVYNDTQTFISNKQAGPTVFETNATERMRITSDGYIGIGTSNPTNAIVHISGAINYNNGVYGYLNSAGNTGYHGSSENHSYSLYASQRIAAGEFNAVSDIRIKTNIETSVQEKNIDILEKINIVEYQYIDIINHSDKKKYGVIAQQLESIDDKFVRTNIDIIPNVYDQFQFINDNEIQVGEVDLAIGDKIRIETKNGLEEVYVEDYKDGIITINTNEENYEEDEVFIYGKEVQDFKMVDYEQLTCLNTSVIQYLLKENTVLKAENNDLKNRIEKLEQIINLSN